MIGPSSQGILGDSTRQPPKLYSFLELLLEVFQLKFKLDQPHTSIALSSGVSRPLLDLFLIGPSRHRPTDSGGHNY